MEVVETLGPVNQVHLAVPDPLAPEDQQVSVIATLDPAVQTSPGLDLELGGDFTRLHFFHPDSGQAI